jgi:hypothetical protein
LFIFWARSIQSTPLHSTSWRSILIFSFHLRLGQAKPSRAESNQAKPSQAETSQAKPKF